MSRSVNGPDNSTAVVEQQGNVVRPSTQGGEAMSEPEEARETKLHLDDAVTLLGASMWERFNPGLAAELGPTWYKCARPAQGAFARYDFASYADCLLGNTERTRAHRALFRKVAGCPWPTYGPALEAAKRARNVIIHPDRTFDRRTAAPLLDDLARIALVLELNVAQELVERAQAVRSGDYSKGLNSREAATAQVDKLAAQLERAQEETASLAERLREADGLLAEKAATVARETEKEQRETELRRQAEEALASAAHAHAERERLERELVVHRGAVEEAGKRAETAEQVSAAAQSERDALDRQMGASQIRIRELEEEARTLAVGIAHSYADEVTVDLHDSQHMSDAAIARVTAGDSAPEPSGNPEAPRANAPIDNQSRLHGSTSTAASTAFFSVRPGQKWPYGTGEYSYSLRPWAEDVYEYETDTWLSDVVGKKKARKVVERLSQYRPEGGTIRVDSDGDVSTHRKSGGGRFYLGRVSPKEWFPDVIRAATSAPAPTAPEVRRIASSPPRTDVGPASHSVRPGQKWPYGTGEYSYSLRPWAEDLYEYETDTWLSDVVGKKKARKVVERLSQYRPEGGTIRVDSDGDVSTQRRSGGGRFSLGRVPPKEWFPAVIEV